MTTLNPTQLDVLEDECRQFKLKLMGELNEKAQEVGKEIIKIEERVEAWMRRELAMKPTWEE